MRIAIAFTLVAGLLAAGAVPAAGTAPAAQQSVAVPAPALPRLQIVQQFGGPFPDTVIQKLYDAQSGVLCYLYIPVKVPNVPDQGIAVYGANQIGSISCLQSAPPVRQ